MKVMCLLLVTIMMVAVPIAAIEMQGINFVGMPYTRLALGDYRAKLALEQLTTTGANWISIPITFYQDFKNSSWSYLGIQPFIVETGVHESPSERDVAAIVTEAKRLGLKVMLQFHTLINMPGWPDSKWIGDYWAPYNAWVWFPRYTENIQHYLKALDGVDVDMISLGHNHFVLSLFEQHWKLLADTLRNETKAKLTYSAAFGDEDRQSGFWESLDYVGVFPIFKSQSLDDLRTEVKEYVRTLHYMHKLWKKPIIVTRVAACSREREYFTQEQLIRIVYDTVKDYSFVKGFFVGDWAADILYNIEGGDISYNIQHKPSEKLVREIFGGQYREVERPEGKADYKLNCDCNKKQSRSS